MKIKRFLKSIDGLSDNTKRVYHNTLLMLQDIVKNSEPTDSEIEQFLTKFKPTTLYRHKAAIKAYLEFQGRQWPFTSRRFRSPRDVAPKSVPRQVVDEIMAAADNEDDYMFVWTLFTLGCRISELMSITPENITDRGPLVIRKGGNETLLVMFKDHVPILKKYAMKKKGRLFPHNYSYYRKKLRDLCEKAGHKALTPHVLRHSRARDLRERGMELDTLKDFLHHASITTTARYTMVDGGAVANKLDKIESGGRDV